MTVAVNRLLEKLPPYEGRKKLVKARQRRWDILNQVLSKHRSMTGHYDAIADDFWKGDPRSTAEYMFRFFKHHIPYKEEGEKEQTTKSPAAILKEAHIYGNDCKHFSGFIVGVGEALARRGYPIRMMYRFVSYDPQTRTPGHVFAVMVHNGKEYWIDPVKGINFFNQRSPAPVYVIDKLPPMSRNNSVGALYDINGLPGELSLNGLDNNSLVSGLNNNTMVSGNDEAVNGHWLDASMGKAKKNKPKLMKNVKNKLKKINIKPGKKLALKFGLSTSRNAYLLLLKLNTFGWAVKLWQKAAKQKGANWQKLAAKWQSLGGKPDALYKSIKEGLNTYNKLHPKRRISGGYDYLADPNNMGIPPEIEMMGAAAASTAALMAAAAPIIAALAALFKSFGINSDKEQQAGKEAADELAEKHNQAPGNADGTVTQPDGSKTMVKTNPDGSQDMYVQPAMPGGSGGGGGGSTSMLQPGETAITPEGPVTRPNWSFKDAMAEVGTFVSNHKWWFIGGAAAIAGFYIIPRLLSSKPKRRR